MGIPLTSSFDVTAGLPLDSRLIVANVTARDAIPSGARYEGMPVYTIAEQKNWFLKGGVANVNWEENKGGGGAGFPALTWLDGEIAPVKEFSTGFLRYVFTPGESQALFAHFTVPEWYEGGQIVLSGLKVSCASSAENIGTRATVTGYRAGDTFGTPSLGPEVDEAMDDSNGADVLVDVSDIEIVDASGQIDGNAIQPDDLIVIKLDIGATNVPTVDIKYLLTGARLKLVEA